MQIPSSAALVSQQKRQFTASIYPTPSLIHSNSPPPPPQTARLRGMRKEYQSTFIISPLSKRSWRPFQGEKLLNSVFFEAKF